MLTARALAQLIAHKTNVNSKLTRYPLPLTGKRGKDNGDF
jgi:hypothetical protein